MTWKTIFPIIKNWWIWQNIKSWIISFFGLNSKLWSLSDFNQPQYWHHSWGYFYLFALYLSSRLSFVSSQVLTNNDFRVRKPLSLNSTFSFCWMGFWSLNDFSGGGKEENACTTLESFDKIKAISFSHVFKEKLLVMINMQILNWGVNKASKKRMSP